MDIRDNAEFRNRLVGLAEVFDAKLSPQRVALYFEALRDLPFEVVIVALSQAVQTCKFFPKPAEIRSLALGDAEDVAEAAWLALKSAFRSIGAYASLVTNDPALGETVIAMFGGWPEACSQDLSPEMWASKRKEFGRVYRVCRGRALEGSRYLAGICERLNAGQADWLRYVTVGVIGPSGEISQLRGDQADGYRTALAARAFSQLSEVPAEFPGDASETA